MEANFREVQQHVELKEKTKQWILPYTKVWEVKETSFFCVKGLKIKWRW